jgi:hypothetical protein
MGLVDPCTTREKIIVNDPERDATLGILSAWYGTFGENLKLVSEVISNAGLELKQKLLTVAANRNESSSVDAPVRWMVREKRRSDFRRLSPVTRRPGTPRNGMEVSCVSSESPKTVGQNDATNGGSSPSEVEPENGPASSPLQPHQNDSPNSLNSPGDEAGEERFEV